MIFEDQGEEQTYMYRKSRNKTVKFTDGQIWPPILLAQPHVSVILCWGAWASYRLGCCWKREEVYEINLCNEEEVGGVDFVEADACGCLATRLNMIIAAVGAIATL